jgi:hypothetical protein
MSLSTNPPVIPGPPEGGTRNPRKPAQCPWIPGSTLRGAPE